METSSNFDLVFGKKTLLKDYLLYSVRFIDIDIYKMYMHTHFERVNYSTYTKFLKKVLKKIASAALTVLSPTKICFNLLSNHMSEISLWVA